MAKRANPYIEDFVPQSKIHVGLKQFNNNEYRLKEVYEKTLDMLFKGAKKLQANDIISGCETNTVRKDKLKQLFIAKDGSLLHSGSIQYSYICSDHFHPEDFYSAEAPRRLIKQSIPCKALLSSTKSDSVNSYDNAENLIEISYYKVDNKCDAKQCSCGGAMECQCTYCERVLCGSCQHSCALCDLPYCNQCLILGSETSEVCVSCYG